MSRTQRTAEQIQADYDRRAGKPQPWWQDLLNFKLANEEATDIDLAQRIGKSKDSVRFTLKSTAFKALYETEKRSFEKVFDTQETLTAMTTGLKFKYSKGQMENASREHLMKRLLDTTTIKEVRLMPVKDETGKETIVETVVDTLVPTVSGAEKDKIALKIFEVVNGKGATIIGKQTNIDARNQSVNISALEKMSPAMRELVDAVIGAVPMKQIENKDGSVEFVLDRNALRTSENESEESDE